MDFGEREFSCGLTYVALSRIKSWSLVAVDPPIGFQRLQAIGKSAQLKLRIAEEERLSKLR